MPDKLSTFQEKRVLLIPATRRDGEAIEKVLKGANIECTICSSIEDLCLQLSFGAGVILVAEEALKSRSEALACIVEGQPVWSDIPIIVLSRSGAEITWLASALARLGNVSVMERPVRISTLLSIVRSSLRARDRQYQSRDYLAEREQLLASERFARGESDRAGRIKDEFLATLSHELRTPLSAILGWSHILGIKSTDPDVLEGAKVIERNARAQSQIIEDLLDMSRIISGKIQLNIQELNLKTIVRAAIDTVKPAAEARGISIKTVLQPDLPSVAGDPDRLQQVFWNLLSNSIKFTPEGGVVQVLLEYDHAHLTLKVVDSGEGIAPEFIPHVFDRFRQADGSSTRSHGGLGLGLAIVKQLIELHGGTIAASSDGKGCGSTFSVSLPTGAIARTAEVDLQKVCNQDDATQAKALNGVQLSGAKILVLDDEPDARFLLKRLLEEKHSIVFVCESAAEAIDVTVKERPDVIISDIGMPGEDGYSFIRRLRQRSPDDGGNTPALALTAYARREDQIAAVQAGFQRHMSKPIEPVELLAVIASLVGR